LVLDLGEAASLFAGESDTDIDIFAVAGEGVGFEAEDGGAELACHALGGEAQCCAGFQEIDAEFALAGVGVVGDLEDTLVLREFGLEPGGGTGDAVGVVAHEGERDIGAFGSAAHLLHAQAFDTGEVAELSADVEDDLCARTGASLDGDEFEDELCDVGVLGAVRAVEAVGGADDGEDGADLGLGDGQVLDAMHDRVGLIDGRSGGHPERDIDGLAVVAGDEDEGYACAGDHADRDDGEGEHSCEGQIASAEAEVQQCGVARDEQAADETLAGIVETELQSLERTGAAGLVPCIEVSQALGHVGGEDEEGLDE